MRELQPFSVEGRGLSRGVESTSSKLCCGCPATTEATSPQALTREGVDRHGAGRTVAFPRFSAYPELRWCESCTNQMHSLSHTREKVLGPLGGAVG